MKLNELSLPSGYVKKGRKRRGRGQASGLGCTGGRGQKGQKSRAGGYHKVGFEGGQMPLQRRLPKRGFTNIFRKEYTIINIEKLTKLSSDVTIDIDFLKNEGLIKKKSGGLKILGKGELLSPLNVKVAAITASAKKKIESAGGKVEVIGV